ncbi:hypothetical protein BDV19DRAFT_187694 [Aspergillus venezuelensis]
MLLCAAMPSRPMALALPSDLSSPLQRSSLFLLHAWLRRCHAEDLPHTVAESSQDHDNISSWPMPLSSHKIPSLHCHY